MREAGGSASGLEPVSNVGDAAFYADPSLFVLKNGRMISIFAPRPIAVAMAAKAVSRMP
jgi:hypothetical protein